MKPMIYVASPYSNRRKSVRTKRAIAVSRFCAGMLNAGHLVFSPIAYMHSIAECFQMPKGFDTYRAFDLGMLHRCDRMIVLKLPGWKTSYGVQCEIEYAAGHRIPIEFVDQ